MIKDNIVENKKENKTTSDYFKDFSFQRILAVKKDCPLSHSELKVYSAIYFASKNKAIYKLSKNKIAEYCDISKPTALKAIKKLQGLALIDQSQLFLGKLPEWVAIGRNGPNTWKLLYSVNLPEAENRLFCMMLALAKEDICRKSLNALSRLSKVDRKKLPKCLKSLEAKGLAKIGEGAVKIIPGLSFWKSQKPKKVQGKERSKGEIQAIALEILKNVPEKVVAKEQYVSDGKQIVGAMRPIRIALEQTMTAAEAFIETTKLARKLLNKIWPIQFNDLRCQDYIYYFGPAWAEGIAQKHEPKKGQLIPFVEYCIGKIS